MALLLQLLATIVVIIDLLTVLSTTILFVKINAALDTVQRLKTDKREKQIEAIESDELFTTCSTRLHTCWRGRCLEFGGCR